jgi:alpha-tubulin suppressor-like RCC1 family protein
MFALGVVVLSAVLAAVLAAVLLPATAQGAQAQRVEAWGDPWSSQGFGHQYDGLTAVSGVRGTVVQISTSDSASYALTRNGTVWAWGVGQFGALGNGTTPVFVGKPVRVHFPAGVKIKSLPSPMPYDAGMAIDTSGHVWVWGSNYGFPLCLSGGNALYPKKLPFQHVTMASGAGSHALYVAGGKLFSCGNDASGELGNGDTIGSKNPVRVVGLPHVSIRAVVSSWEDSGVLLSDGAFYDWGYNAADQLGNGTGEDSAVPVHVDLPAPVALVSMGGSDKFNGQTAAILSNGSTWAWGSNQFGQLGIGKLSPSAGPTLVAVPPGVSFVQVDSGGSSVYGITHSGAVWSWGQNDLGQLGLLGRRATARPTAVGVDLTSVSSTAGNVAGLGAAQR